MFYFSIFFVTLFAHFEEIQSYDFSVEQIKEYVDVFQFLVFLQLVFCFSTFVLLIFKLDKLDVDNANARSSFVLISKLFEVRRKKSAKFKHKTRGVD